MERSSARRQRRKRVRSEKLLPRRSRRQPRRHPRRRHPELPEGNLAGVGRERGALSARKVVERSARERAESGLVKDELGQTIVLERELAPGSIGHDHLDRIADQHAFWKRVGWGPARAGAVPVT